MPEWKFAGQGKVVNHTWDTHVNSYCYNAVFDCAVEMAELLDEILEKKALVWRMDGLHGKAQTMTNRFRVPLSKGSTSVKIMSSKGELRDTFTMYEGDTITVTAEGIHADT